MPATDGDLVRAALGGSQLAYRELVSRHTSAALNLIVRLVQDRALAEDLTQDAFIRAFERLATFDQSRKFSSWFLQVAHNVAIDHLRRKRRDTVPLDAMTADGAGARIPPDPSPSPHVQAERAAIGAALDAALAQLRPEYRAVVVLHYQQGRGHDEIAGILDVPVGTVKTYLHRARKELAGLLAASGWRPRETLTATTPVETAERR